ncbi:MAG: manganese efflux pump, partial [Bacteroidales bacterium]|nr:manganese efflux pump [Bacteroidales bacterium]
MVRGLSGADAPCRLPLGSSFAEYIAAVDHWIAMILLCLIGGNMIRESQDRDPEHVNPSLGVKTMFIMAVATS